MVVEYQVQIQLVYLSLTFHLKVLGITGLVDMVIGYVLAVNNGVLLQFGTIKTATTTLPLSYNNTYYRIYLGYIAGTDGCWYTASKTQSTFVQMEKHYGTGYVTASINNYYLTLGF